MSARCISATLAVLALATAAMPARPAAAAPEGGLTAYPIPTSGSQAAPISSSASPQALGWETIALEGATCGLGAPFKYFLNEASDPNAGLFIFLMGGGACLKSGPPPPGLEGPAAQLHCMAFPNFVEPTDTYHLVSAVVPFLNRLRADNPYREYHFAFIPYCTGDLHAGSNLEPNDYDPGPDEFLVTHRGRANVLAVLDDLKQKYAGDRHVVFTGSSAGGLGAILNYHAAASRWPSAVLIADAGIAPASTGSLIDVYGREVVDRWAAYLALPPYCAGLDCLTDSLRLLEAHADHHDGRDAPWRPFGYLQGQRDATLASWLELSPCTYEMSLRASLARHTAFNLRGYLPATEQHTFLAANDGFVSSRGVQVLEWFAQVAAATSAAELPPSATDPWLACNPIGLPMLSHR